MYPVTLADYLLFPLVKLLINVSVQLLRIYPELRFLLNIHIACQYIRYRQSVPEDVLFVSESGIKTKEDIRQLMEHNVNGVLIGETMMRADDRVAAVKEFIGYAE